MKMGRFPLPMETDLYVLLIGSFSIMMIIGCVLTGYLLFKSKQFHLVFYLLHFLLISGSSSIWFYLFSGPVMPVSKVDEEYSARIVVAAGLWFFGYVSLFFGIWKSFEKKGDF